MSFSPVLGRGIPTGSSPVFHFTPLPAPQQGDRSTGHAICTPTELLGSRIVYIDTRSGSNKIS